MPIQDNPVRSRRHLVAILREMRERCGLTQKQVLAVSTRIGPTVVLRSGPNRAGGVGVVAL
jgi:hypothetical protein